jgi:cobalt-zinc-cadmium efflux system membrane fusion protein
LVIPFSCRNAQDTDQVSSDGQVENSNDRLITVTKAQFDSGKMVLGKTSAMEFPEYVRTTGFIDVPPSNKAVINAFAGGYIKSTKLLVGDRVKKGQILVTIENPEFIHMQQEFLEAAEQLVYLQNEFQRQKSLYDERITSQKNYLKAESDFKKTLARHNSLDKQLRMLNLNPEKVKEGVFATTANIYAPIDGSITKISINMGSYVSPADEIMEIVNLNHIHLELDVFEKDIMQIKKEQNIEFKIPESSIDTYKGEVHLVGSQIDATKRTVEVHGHFDSLVEQNFAVGMFVEAAIVIDSKPVITLPEEAIIEMEDRTFVLKMTNRNGNSYTFERVEVIVSGPYNGFVSIDNGAKFNDSDQFLIKGAYALISN